MNRFKILILSLLMISGLFGQNVLLNPQMYNASVIDSFHIKPESGGDIMTFLYDSIADEFKIYSPTSTDISIEGIVASDYYHLINNDSDDITEGLTNLFFLPAERSKLTGIETNATADQTANEILTALLGVDGTGSLLDADLLDGQSASAFTEAWEEANNVYVGKHGNDSNDGKSIDDAFLTFGQAITYANSQTPSGDNRIAITCFDAGTYTENLTVPSWVGVIAPAAKIVGNHIVTDNSLLQGFRLVASTGTVITKSVGTGATTIVCPRMILSNDANGVVVELGTINYHGNSVEIENGTAFGNATVGIMHVRVTTIEITGTGVGVKQTSTGKIVLRSSNISDSGSGSGIIITGNGTVHASVTEIDCSVAYNNGNNGTLMLVSAYIGGTQTNAGTLYYISANKGISIAGDILLTGTVDGIDIATDVTANTAKITNATHTGDVAGATVLTIGNDKILESMLKAVNAPTDEYVLTYELTTGDFEWQAVVNSESDPIYTASQAFNIDAGDITNLGNLSGTNTGDQTSIVGITGTIAQFNTALSDGSLAISGGAFHDGFSDFVSGEHFLQSAISIPASQISDFDTEVANNSAVTANTAKITNATHTGDVAGATVLTIGNDKILESMLKAVNAPVDEYVLTYELTTGDFEWQPATSGGTLTTLKESTVQVGGADIVTIDFGSGFDLVETPDTEINITFDPSEIAGHDLFTDFVSGEHFLQSAISIPASQISDFDTEVANNSAVTANTAKITTQWTTTGSDIYYNTGNVGIGIASSDGLVHIFSGSAGVVTANTTYDDLTVENSDHVGLQFLSPNDKFNAILFGDVDDNDIGSIKYSHSANTMAFLVNTSNALKLYDDLSAQFYGDVGIGITNPSSKLDINYNAISTTQSDVYGISLTNTTPATAIDSIQSSPPIVQAGTAWKTDATAGSQKVEFRSWVKPKEGTSAPTGDWFLQSSINDGAYSDLLTVNSGGNVGIGTTSPVDKLHILGNTVNDVTFRIGNDEIGGDDYLTLRLLGGTAYSIPLWVDSGVLESASAGGLVIGSLAGDISFYADNDRLADMTIEVETGNVGIGTASPQEKLHVYGTGANSYAEIESGDGNPARLILTNTEGYAHIDVNSNTLRMATAGTVAMTIDASQRVGIGTASPDDLLDIESGNILLSSSDVVRIQLLNNAEDNVGIFFDSKYSSGWKSGDIGSNYGIYKEGNKLKLVYDSGITVGSTITWNDGIVLNTSGDVGIGTTSPGTTLEVKSGSGIKITNSTNTTTYGIINAWTDDNVYFDIFGTSASSGSLVLRTGDASSTTTFSANGNVNMSGTLTHGSPSFSVFQADTSQSGITTSAYNKVRWDLKDSGASWNDTGFAIGAGGSGGATNSRWTPGVIGIYQFNCAVWLDAGGHADQQLYAIVLYINGVKKHEHAIKYSGTGNYQSPMLSTAVYMDADDYAEIYIWQASGSTQRTVSSSEVTPISNYTWWQGYKVQ